jgi:hypothetical protein
VSVVFGCLVGILTNLAKGGGASASTLGGMASGILAWASWEAWRAIRAAADHDSDAGGGG